MKKVLFIEDNDDIRNNTAEILELANYNVLTAENGKMGVEKALHEKPDLIVCDIMMPVLDGYGVFHTLQKNPQTMNTPFIFLTAKTDKSDFRKGMELGADDYITKPFTGTDLLNAVESRLRKAENIKQQFISNAEELLKEDNSRDMLKELTEGRNINKYRKKQVIYFEGNRPGRLFYVQKGKVKTYKRNESGKELVIELYKPKDFLGYTALLEGASYKETAEAMEDTELALIPKEDFEELMNSNHKVAKKFIRLLAKNITEIEEHLLGLAYNSLRKKVATALVEVDEKYNPEGNKDFSIKISRESLATIAGTATESLIRTLTDFKNEQLIDMDHGNIILLHKSKLQNMLN
jgi:CRP/FNR family cyclic AMP-dependent transcriptional regulator